MTNASTSKTLRSAAATRIALIAAACAAAFLGTYDVVSGNAAYIGAESGLNKSTTSASAPGSADLPFTEATVGDCLTWDISTGGSFDNFNVTSCAGEHRFEVAAVENLADAATGEFDSEANMPSMERQTKLREEMCESPSLRYLNGQFDPDGKYSIASILPPSEAWSNGDRTMLCGLQTTDEDGIPQLTENRVSEVDQANLATSGQCREIGDDQVLRTVNCSQPHHLETTSVVNLSEEFPKDTPSVDDQNDFLTNRCTDDAIAYLGDEEDLYRSTLQPYWGTISATSWKGGTRSVNCSLIHPGDDSSSFSVITGTAKDGLEGLTIDGAAPTERPARNPLRNSNSQGSSDASEPAPVDANDSTTQ